MKKLMTVRAALFIPALLIVSILLSACNQEAPRLPAVYSHNPGPLFQTNLNDEDHRRVIRCAVMFEVIDERAQEELSGRNFVVRNAVLSVLGELTMDEVTQNKDLEEISERLVERVNEAIGSYIPLVVGAYFTEFAVS